MASSGVGLVRGPTERSGAAGDEPPVRLAGPARAWRALLLLGLAVAFAAGAVVGQGTWWPFSPWGMFSTSAPPRGAVVALAVGGGAAAGTPGGAPPLYPPPVRPQ